MIRALLLWSQSSFCYFFLLLFNTSATPPANKHCSQRSVSEPVLAKSLTHQHPPARRSIVEKETIGRVPCHQLACYEWNANVFVCGSMISFLQAIEKHFPAKLSVHSFSPLGFRIGKMSHFLMYFNFIVADSIPNEGSWSSTLMLTSDLHCKKQYLNKRQVSLSLKLHCKQLWRTPT